MESRKTLYIILVVGVVIFVISLVIGRPVWQAALFGIGFLLIAAIVSSSGLLIPEGLFGRRRPRRRSPDKPTEDIDQTGKAAFLERMDSELAEFSAQPEATTENIRWMTEYTQVIKEVGELAYTVHENVRSKDRAKQARAFREVIKELPRLISQFRNIPEGAIPQRQKTMEHQIEGMDLYLEACSSFAQALERGDGNLAGDAAMQINKALNRLDIMDKSQVLRGR